MFVTLSEKFFEVVRHSLQYLFSSESGFPAFIRSIIDHPYTFVTFSFLFALSVGIITVYLWTAVDFLRKRKGQTRNPDRKGLRE